MSLLSSLDGVTDLHPEAEEKDKVKESEEAPKLPRTNSLEDLGIKVRLFVCFHLLFLSKCNGTVFHLCFK